MSKIYFDEVSIGGGNKVINLVMKIRGRVNVIGQLTKYGNEWEINALNLPRTDPTILRDIADKLDELNGVLRVVEGDVIRDQPGTICAQDS